MEKKTDREEWNYFHSLIHYNPLGFWQEDYKWCFQWQENARSKCHGKSGVNDNGYLFIEMDGINYQADNLAFFMITGRWPKKQLIHLNGEKLDNRFSNLMEPDEDSPQD